MTACRLVRSALAKKGSRHDQGHTQPLLSPFALHFPLEGEVYAFLTIFTYYEYHKYMKFRMFADFFAPIRCRRA